MSCQVVPGSKALAWHGMASQAATARTLPRSQHASAGAGEYSRRHWLSESTLDMLADMRWQFAVMLADIGFVAGERSLAPGTLL